MTKWSTMTLQDASSLSGLNMIYFHDLAMMIIMMIMSVITYLMMMIFFNKLTNRFLTNNQLIESIWTITPIFILLFLVVPSLSLLYSIDDFNYVNFTIKSIGHQWYWSYEYSDFNHEVNFDSFMIKLFEMNSFRLLDVDNRMIIPFNTPIRLITTSMDVIHSWAMPSMGIKVDAVPGRLNQMFILKNTMGLSFGQCSEICGANHSFMPIVLETTSMNEFMLWANSY